jgi:hypothetical protein
MILAAHRSWPEVVFHVLAHVSASASLPSSLFDPTYVAWSAQALGPVTERPLAEDADVLGQALSSHESLGRAQLLAWLYDDADRACALADRDLTELDDRDVLRPELLPTLRELGAPVEVLRIAAALEWPGLAARPPPPVPHALITALGAVADLAPALARVEVVPLRSLRLRGRVLGDCIFVGLPGSELSLDADHVAWQAAHEATVLEVSVAEASQAHPLAERAVERVALALLAERARHAGLATGHETWLAHLAGPPSTDPTRLAPNEQAAYEARLRSPT